MKVGGRELDAAGDRGDDRGQRPGGGRAGGGVQAEDGIQGWSVTGVQPCGLGVYQRQSGRGAVRGDVIRADGGRGGREPVADADAGGGRDGGLQLHARGRSEEHTCVLQSLSTVVYRQLVGRQIDAAGDHRDDRGQRSGGGRAGVGDFFFFFNDTATTEIYTLSLHDALPI